MHKNKKTGKVVFDDEVEELSLVVTKHSAGKSPLAGVDGVRVIAHVGVPSSKKLDFDSVASGGTWIGNPPGSARCTARYDDQTKPGITLASGGHENYIAYEKNCRLKKIKNMFENDVVHSDNDDGAFLPQNKFAVVEPGKNNVVGKVLITKTPADLLYIQDGDDITGFGDVELGAVHGNAVQLNAKAFGVVIYGDASIYADGYIENSGVHIKPTPMQAIAGLYEHLMVSKPLCAIKQITLGHEHGENNGKCHYQVCVQFDGTVRVRVCPFKLVIDGCVLLCMMQRAKNSSALDKYCHKGGDVFYLNDPVMIEKVFKVDKKSGLVTDKVDVSATILKNTDVSYDSLVTLLAQYDPALFLGRAGQMGLNFDKFFSSSRPLEPEWVYPFHLKGKYPIMEDWFNRNCLDVNVGRRKALLIYSKNRAMGKSMFARSLIGGREANIITFRGTFTETAYKSATNPKLLLLDDMSHWTSNNKETWKALCSGEPTSIRDCHVNFLFAYSLPCIITSNNESLFASLRNSSEFNTQVTFVELGVDDFLGPVDSRPDNLTRIEENTSRELLDVCLRKKRQQEKWADDRHGVKGPDGERTKKTPVDQHSLGGSLFHASNAAYDLKHRDDSIVNRVTENVIAFFAKEKKSNDAKAVMFSKLDAQSIAVGVRKAVKLERCVDLDLNPDLEKMSNSSFEGEGDEVPAVPVSFELSEHSNLPVDVTGEKKARSGGRGAVRGGRKFVAKARMGRMGKK